MRIFFPIIGISMGSTGKPGKVDTRMLLQAYTDLIAIEIRG